jgi:hypothetical protein
VNGSFALGFDHDRRDVFERTACWIEDNRLECATFHIYKQSNGLWRVLIRHRLTARVWHPLVEWSRRRHLRFRRRLEETGDAIPCGWASPPVMAGT